MLLISLRRARATSTPKNEKKTQKNSEIYIKKSSPHLATSVPERSSLGSGSVYPSALASATTSAKLLPGESELKM